MLGFICKTVSKDLVISGEVDEAGWFSIEEAKSVLSTGSIVMQLLEEYIASNKL
jgi:NADH pyrophosphatase NudC (nudix superfamily)